MMHDLTFCLMILLVRMHSLWSKSMSVFVPEL